MNWKTSLSALIGFVWGAAISAVVVSHIFAAQAQKLQVQWAVDSGSVEIAAQKRTMDAAQGAIDAWKRRAEVCEDRFAGATVIYEYHPAVSLPLANGLFTFSLGSGADPMGGEAKPAWWIPAKVKVYTNQPGASYSWIDATGIMKGPWGATPPPPQVQP